MREVLKDEGLEASTMDSFQGREKEVIIFSITSTDNLDFTRTKKKLIVLFRLEDRSRTYIRLEQ